MGGDYAVGGTKFWIFFVIAIPVVICIGTLLFTNVALNTRKYFNGCFSSLRDAIKGALSHSRGRNTIRPKIAGPHSLLVAMVSSIT